jgi:hypothetical protein
MNIETARQTIANCTSYRSCTCFDEILTLQPFNFESNIDYIRINQRNLERYYSTLVKHINKDIFHNQDYYSTVSAETLKKSLDHHIDTLNRFQRYLLPLINLEDIVFSFDHKNINVYDYLQTVLQLTLAHESAIRLFNFPNSKLKSKEILDEIDLHIYTLKLFEEVICEVNNYKANKSFFKLFRIKKHNV